MDCVFSGYSSEIALAAYLLTITALGQLHDDESVGVAVAVALAVAERIDDSDVRL